MDANLPLGVATLAWLAFGIGAVFGYAAQRSNFCTMGAIADIHIMEDWTRLRMWALAAATGRRGIASTRRRRTALTAGRSATVRARRISATRRRRRRSLRRR
mgnify:CR=1 FL=1